MTTEEFFNAHERVVLELSGGKDSAACLWLLEPWWDRLIVVWCNPGNPYPETVAYMEQIKKFVPFFVEVNGEQKAWIAENGYPVDVLPIDSTSVAPLMGVESSIKLVSMMNCCAHNMWAPLDHFVRYFGFTGVIRGVKNSDRLKGPYVSGDWCEGIQFFHPVEDWSNEDVVEFLGDRIPASYKRGLTSSLDCMNCTAYVDHNKGRISDLDSIDAEAAAEVRLVHGYLRDKLIAHVSYLE